MFLSKAIRSISAVGGAAVLLAVLFTYSANGSVNLQTVPRRSTPAEVGQAALDGQLQAMREVGYNNQCLTEVEVNGERCIESCIIDGSSGFFIAIKLQHPQCSVIGCVCEENELGIVGGKELHE